MAHLKDENPKEVLSRQYIKDCIELWKARRDHAKDPISKEIAQTHLDNYQDLLKNTYGN